MLDKNLYKDTFSALTASDETLSEIMNATIHRKRRTPKAISIVATVAILTVALAGTAFSANVFGVRDFIIPNPHLAFTSVDVQPEDAPLDDAEVPMSELLLAGFLNSPEYQAAMEWRNRNQSAYVYLEGIGNVRWDEESAAFVHAETGAFVTKGIMTVENQETLDSLTPEELEDYIVILCRRDELPEVYQWYWASSWAEVEVIDEIAERHGLALYGEIFNYYHENRSWEEFQASIATEPFIDNADAAFTLHPGYRWEGGTFQFDAQYGDIWFQFRSNRKGVFDVVIAGHADRPAFTDEWVYENVHGTTLLLAQRADQSLILADTETAFILISIGAGTGTRTDWEGATLLLTPSDLEHFADLIDFSQLR